MSLPLFAPYGDDCIQQVNGVNGTAQTIAASNQVVIPEKIREVRVIATAGDGAIDLLLPPPQRARGMSMYIVTEDAGGGIVIRAIQADRTTSLGTLDADNDHLLITAVGDKWLTVVNGIS